MRAAEQTVLCGVVSMGNPHCVIQVDDVDTAAVETLGPVMESHERFPERANIGFMQVVGGLISVCASTNAARGNPGLRQRRLRRGGGGIQQGLLAKRYAWNYPAVDLISPGKARASRYL